MLLRPKPPPAPDKGVQEAPGRVRAALSTITFPIRAVRDAIARRLIEPFESKSPEGNRTSFARKRLLSMCGAFGLAVASLMHAVREPDDPIPFAYAGDAFGEPGHGDPPGRDAPQESLLVGLRHPDDLSAFLYEHTEHSYPEGLFDFLETYRAPPEEFLRRTKTVRGAGGATEKAHGPCNNPAEQVARWLWAHGVRPSIGRTRPGIADLVLDWQWKKCHEVTLYRTVGDEYVIFSNCGYNVVRAASPKAALESLDPGSTVLEQGGIVPWRQTRDNAVARFFHTLGDNQAELLEHPRHRIVPRPGTVVADAGAPWFSAAISDMISPLLENKKQE